MAAETTEIELSPRTKITLKPVNMLEQLTAEVYAGALASKLNISADFDLKVKCWAICSIRSINGVERKPLSNINEFMAVAEDIDGSESSALVLAYVAHGLGDPKAGKAPAEEPSSS